ncbi:MAG: metallophosphoesterase family protein [Planctomycetes bacterium]|nr:metallophosphoesterase family protein [Planctomycetota bacterium]
MALTAVISDIHSNIHALRSVLDDAGEQGAERIVCLGDVVGYGAHPVECADMAMKFSVCLRGNHEAGLLGALDGFNYDARRAAEWTRDLMKTSMFAGADKKARWNFITNLPERCEEEDALFVHGSPRDPVWEYLFESNCAGPLEDARENVVACRRW